MADKEMEKKINEAVDWWNGLSYDDCAKVVKRHGAFNGIPDPDEFLLTDYMNADLALSLYIAEVRKKK